jgi:hypothetical protein
LGVEHGDYNGTELFGVGTDRFIWLAYKRNNSDTVRIFSDNFADDGVITFKVLLLTTPPNPRPPCSSLIQCMQLPVLRSNVRHLQTTAERCGRICRRTTFRRRSRST